MISNPQEAYTGLVGALYNQRASMVDAGHALQTLKTGFREVFGEGVDTWYDFLNQPEIGLSVREANELIELSEYVMGVGGMGVLDIATKSLKKLAKEGITEEETIGSARTLSVKDFKDRYYDIKTKESGPRTYTYMVMRRCLETGNLEKVHGIDEQIILKTIAP